MIPAKLQKVIKEVEKAAKTKEVASKVTNNQESLEDDYEESIPKSVKRHQRERLVKRQKRANVHVKKRSLQRQLNY